MRTMRNYGTWQIGVKPIKSVGNGVPGARIELATRGFSDHKAHLTKCYQMLINNTFTLGLRAGQITNTYQVLPSQIETKQKHRETVRKFYLFFIVASVLSIPAMVIFSYGGYLSKSATRDFASRNLPCTPNIN